MFSSKPSVQQALSEFVAKNGPWTAHPITLAPGISTIQDGVNENHLLYLARIVQAARDLVGPLKQVRVLDLGALEGGFAIEFAMHGAESVAVEGRSINCERIRFAKESLGLRNLKVIEADVRSLKSSELGTFDVVLCLGLFYHIDRASILPFTKTLFEMTRGICIIDTHVSLFGRHSLTHGGSTYSGDLFFEHAETASDEEVQRNNWASLGREPSFFFTEPSFCNLMQDVGFSSLMSVKNPYYRTMLDRSTFVAVKGAAVPLLSHSLSGQAQHPEQPCLSVVEPINKLPRLLIG